MLDLLDVYEDRDWQQADANAGPVRFALIGLGWWTMDVALPAIENSTFGETTVLVSSSASKAERLADDHGVPQGISYDAFHEGAAAEAYDAVYVGTPNAYHLDYVETAATLDKAVLCEKPMEATVERAERLVTACRDADVPLMIAYRMHTDPAVRLARDLVREGVLGDPVSVHGEHSQPLLEMNPDPDQWRLDPDVTGYGTSVMDLGIYSLNTTRFLLERDPVTVQSRMDTSHEAFATLPDERAASIIAFEDEIPLVSTSSQRANTTSVLRVTGTDGTIELKPAFQGECHLHLSRGDLSIDVRHASFDAQREMREEFDYFADHVLTDTPITPDGEHGLVDMQTIAALHEAAETGRCVDVRRHATH